MYVIINNLIVINIVQLTNLSHFSMSKTKVERFSTSPVAGFAGQYGVRRRRSPRMRSYAVGTSPTHSSQINLQPTLPLSLRLPEDTELLDNQVAGHMYDIQGKSVGMLKHKDDYILKPITKPMCGEREMRFYVELQTTKDPILQELKLLVPGYHGTKNISVCGKEVTCLVLDNIAKGLKEPCIMDIKIGRRTWDPLATAEKIQNENKKYVQTRRDLGFCIPGFQVKKLSDGKLHKYGKDYGKQLNGETVKDALKLFLNAETGLCRPLVVQLLGLLWRILSWCRKQKKVRLYSSSLLLVYDARLLRHNLQNNSNASLILHPSDSINNRCKRIRPPSLAISDSKNDSLLLSPGFSGQFTSEGPKFERSISTNSAHLLPANPVNKNCPWKKSLKKLQRTHSFSNNYEVDLQHLKQKYVYMLDDLIDDSSNLWANIKMIDFAHVFPAEDNTLDTNYLEGIENLVKIFESLLQESEL